MISIHRFAAPFFSALAGAATIGSLWFYSSVRNQEELQPSETITEDTSLQAEPEIPVEPVDRFKVQDVRVQPNSSLYQALVESGLTPKDVLALVRATKPVFNLSKVPADTAIQIRYRNDEVTAIDLKISTLEELHIKKTGEATEQKWTAEMISKNIQVSQNTFYGQVNTSLWDSAIASGVDANVILKLAGIFAWQIDFDREVRPGDRWRLVIEQLAVDGEPYGWGNILAAEYVLAGETYAAVRFPSDHEKAGYFDIEGQNMKSRFLKSPLRFGRISSRFQRKRFHPILKVARPHYGVDYAAPKGTPVRAVGSGVVTVAASRGGSGRMVRIRHNSVYQTAYKHLNRYGKGIRRGKKVEQGDVIGYVGMTGLATGPHLHFEFYENGRFVDPLGRKFPRAAPVKKHQLSQFKQAAEQLLNLLPIAKSAEKEGPADDLATDLTI